MTSKNTQKEASKGEQFTNKVPTAIFLEEPSEGNVFIAEKQYLHGYDYEELVSNLDYHQMLYLMLAGELPDEKQSAVLHLLLKLLMTPGVRHPATRAAMNAGIGRTQVTHVLPISLSVLSSDYLGSVEVGNAMRWYSEKLSAPFDDIFTETRERVEQNIPNPIPGLGTIYGSIDTYTLKLVNKVKDLGFELPYFNQVSTLLEQFLKAGVDISWLPTGLSAALFLDIGLTHRTGTVLFQMLQSPGLAAHGIEKANKPLTDMPFIPESNYEIKSPT